MGLCELQFQFLKIDIELVKLGFRVTTFSINYCHLPSNCVDPVTLEAKGLQSSLFKKKKAGFYFFCPSVLPYSQIFSYCTGVILSI